MNHPLAYSVNWDALDAELDSLHPSHGSIFEDEEETGWRLIFHPADFNDYQRAENRFREPETHLTREEILDQLNKRPVSDGQAVMALVLLNLFGE